MTEQITFRCRECGYVSTIDVTENAGTNDTAELCPKCELKEITPSNDELLKLAKPIPEEYYDEEFEWNDEEENDFL